MPQRYTVQAVYEDGSAENYNLTPTKDELVDWIRSDFTTARSVSLRWLKDELVDWIRGDFTTARPVSLRWLSDQQLEADFGDEKVIFKLRKSNATRLFER